MKPVILSLFQKLQTMVDVNNAPLIKRIALFNDQFNTYEKDHAIPLPAVLVEIMPIAWARVKRGVQNGTLNIKFHLGQEIYTDDFQGSATQAKALAVFDLLQSLYLTLQNFQMPNCSPMERVQTITDTQYGNCIVHIVEYTCTYNDDTKAVQEDAEYIKITPDLQTQIEE
jgi:hypothetical protein